MTAKRWEAHGGGGLDDFRFVDHAVPQPDSGQVTIDVRAAGVNPADLKHTMRDGAQFPLPVGYEVAGVISAIGPDTEIGSGPVSLGDEVLAFRIRGGYATAITVPARDVFAKPASVPFEKAANLLLAGTTAAEMLDVVGAAEGETVLLHGASGAVGVAVCQLARARGIAVIGTAGESGAERVRRFGGVAVAYGDGLLDRVREIGPVDAALDAAGTDEAFDVSAALVDPDRFVTVVNMPRAEREGLRAIAGAMPASAAFRDAVRAELIAMAGRGDLDVPIARTVPLADAVDALAFVMDGHPGGKVALIP
ncbi:NADP-dependent oxidoreductase [Williamsia herbipolensis]|uniref:NADP-dependent oxidoreductase n=1 Tax=Williamsia herbipolensis TaxID=1603258 RepID=A0AAU4JXW0_9NOCA|nr:NADP-dependent oxidoreductase [Williamsia herbipolensis]